MEDDDVFDQRMRKAFLSFTPGSRIAPHDAAPLAASLVHRYRRIGRPRQDRHGPAAEETGG